LNGLIWTGTTGANFGGTGNHGYGIGSDGSRWVAVGIGSTGPIIVSSNGISWTYNGITGYSNFKGNDVIYGGDTWVAAGFYSSGGGDTGAILNSTDGLTWTSAENVSFTTTANSVSYNGGQFVAVGDGPNPILLSDDGINWSYAGVTSDPFAGGTGMSVTWNGTRWVAIGSTGNTIITSLDGLNWAGATGDLLVNGVDVASNYGRSYGAFGYGSQEGATGPRGTVIFYGYGVPYPGLAGYISPGPTGLGPTGPGIQPQKTGDFYLNFDDGRLYLTP
jgi:hypothetical protein